MNFLNYAIFFHNIVGIFKTNLTHYQAFLIDVLLIEHNFHHKYSPIKKNCNLANIQVSCFFLQQNSVLFTKLFCVAAIILFGNKVAQVVIIQNLEYY